MTTRLELEAMMRLLMKKAKAKYGTLEMISWKTGVSTKSLHRYEIGEVLPSLEVYAILCECIGCRCYSEQSGSDVLFITYYTDVFFNGSDRFVRSIEFLYMRWYYCYVTYRIACFYYLHNGGGQKNINVLCNSTKISTKHPIIRQ